MARVINQMDRSTTDLPPGVSNAGGDGSPYADPAIPAPADGDVRGDPRSLPNRGSRSGVIWGDDYGANLEAGFNALGSAHMPSDPAEMVMPKGDSDFRFSAATHTADDRYGEDRGLKEAARSDAADYDMTVNAHKQTGDGADSAQEMTTGPKGPLKNGPAPGPRGAEGSPEEEAGESAATERKEREGY